MFKRSRSQQSGYMLIFTIIAVTVSVLIVIPILSFVSTAHLSTIRTQERLESSLSRNAGVEYGIATLKNNRTTLTGLNSAPATPVPLSLPPAQTNTQTVTSLTATLLTPSQWDLVMKPQSPQRLVTGPKPNRFAALMADGFNLLHPAIARAAPLPVSPSPPMSSAAPGDPGTTNIIKNSQATYNATGAVLTNLDTTTTPGDMFLDLGTPAAAYTTGPVATATVGAGAHSIQRPNGTFLVIRGNNATTTNIYDPVANTLVAGPALAGNAGAGANSVQRPNGTFLIVRGNASTGTNIYDPVANTMSAGPTFASAIGAGSNSLQRPNGTFLIVRGGGTTSTFIYDPVANSLTSGPALGGNAGAGSQAIQRPNGTFFIVRGNASTGSDIYDPVANTISAGLTFSSAVGAGSHSIQRPNGTFLIVRGGATTSTFIYDPVANTLVAGPALSANAGTGAHSFQRADGNFLMVLGNNSSGTTVYNPTANTAAAGPALGNNAGAGAHSLERPNDGRYLIFRGNSTTTTYLYDAGWFTSGQYVSENLSPSNITSWNTLGWTQTADNTVTFNVRTATTSSGLTSAVYRSVTNGGSIGAGAGEIWLQVRASYSRVIPVFTGADANVWMGESNSFSQRTFPTPDVQSITMNYSVYPNLAGALTQYQADGVTVIPTGGYSSGTSVVLKFTMASPAGTDTLTPQVEVQPNGTAFSNTATNSGSSQGYTGTSLLGSVAITGLTEGTDYHWQASVGGVGGNSPWTPNGGNPDFGTWTSVAIGKTGSPGTVSAGDPVTYTITVTHPTSGTGKVTAITDTLASGFSYVTGSTTGATTADPSIVGQTLTWTLSANVTSGAPLSLSFNAAAPLTAGTFNDNASVQGANFTTASTGSTAPIVVNVPVMSIVKQVNQSTVTAGDTVSYTVTVSNSGVGAGRVTAITDTLPTGFTYVTGSTTGTTTADPSIVGQTLTWTLARNITNGGSITLSFSATTATTGGTYNNNASAQGSNFTTVNTGNTAPVTVNAPSVSIAKVVYPGTVAPSDLVTYTITVNNSGAGVARITSLTDTLATGFSYITGSASGVTIADPSIVGQLLTWTLSQNISNGGSITLSFQATSSSSVGTYNDNASVLGSNFTTVSTGDTAPVVVALPTVTIGKTANPTSVYVTNNVTYTITVSNTSGGPAYLTSITDTLDTGFTYNTGSTTGTTTTDPSIVGQSLTWNISRTITAGSNVTLSFVAASPSSTGTYYNNASASGADFTTVSTGSTAAVTVNPTPPAPGTVNLLKTNQADFEAAGSTRTNLDTSTTPGDMFLMTGTTPGTTYTSGPVTGSAVSSGGFSIQRPNGTFLVVRGNGSTTTFVYDPVANSFTSGPALGGNAGAGAHAVQRPNGTFLIVWGNNATGTNIYDPVANTMSTGPTFSSAIGAGAHSIQRLNGTFLVIRGNNSTTTFIYDPVANSFTSGPVLGGNAGAGAHSFQRANGTFLIIRGNNTTGVNIYDPVANTMSAGTALTAAGGAGAHSIQRPDGQFLIVLGNNTTTTLIYNAGYYVSGQYTSEQLNPPNIVAWNTLAWTQTADQTITFNVRTAATSAALTSAGYRGVTNGGNINPGAGEVWLQMQANYSRAIPVYPGADNDIWGGESHTFYQRTFPRPDVQDITLNYSVYPNVAASLTQYKSDGVTVIPTGSYTNETTVILKFSMTSPAILDTLTPQIEVQPLGTGFTNTPTGSGLAAAYSGSPVTGAVTVSALTQGTDYHWQARVINSNGNGVWVANGGNPDFGVQTTVSIGKTASPGTANSGDPITYTITVTNTGAGAAKLTAVTDTLASGFTYLTGSTTGATTGNPSIVGQTLTWTFSSNITPGTPLTLSFQATAASSAGTYYDNASAQGLNFTTASTGSTAPVVVAPFTISIGKTVSPGTVTIGDPVTYTITLSATGVGTANVTAITDTLPSGFSYVTGSTTGTTISDPSIAGQLLTWTLSRAVTSGSPVTLSFSANSSTTAGTYNNNASVQGSNFSTVSTGNTAPVTTAVPVVGITKSVNPTSAFAGDPVTYTITVTNTGSGTAKTTAIVDTLAAGFTYVPGSTTGDFTTSDPGIVGQTLTWTFSKNISASQSQRLYFQATTSLTPGTYNNNASVQGSDFTTVNTGSTAPVTTVARNVLIGKTVNNSSVSYGDNVIYTITVTNSGGASVQLTSFTDTLATGFAYVTASTTGTTTSDPSIVGQTLTWSITRTINASSNITLSFSATVPYVTGTFNDNASATGSNFPTVSTGNTAPVNVNPTPAGIVISQASGDTSGPPGWTNVNVTGYYFPPQKSVILYWVDLNNGLIPTTDPPTGTALTGTITTLSSSFKPLSFSPVTVSIPATANWGNGYIVAVMEQSTGTWIEQDRKPFNVRAKYEIAAQTADGVTLTGRAAFTGARSADGAYATPTNTPLITIYEWKEQ